MKKFLFILLFFCASILQADVAFQYGWDREPIDSANKSAVDLEEVLQKSTCVEVKKYSNDSNLSAVVARGLHGTDNDPRAHYTVRLYNCKESNLGYVGYVLKCDNSKWQATYHVLNDGTCP